MTLKTDREDARNMVAMVDLDPRLNDERLELKEETTSIVLGENEKQCTYIGGSMPEDLLNQLFTMLRINKYLFAWKATDIPGSDRCHKLSVCQGAKPVSQKRRKLGEER